jgi:uncharacterized membrane protein YdjX (TVP38/TMEM64 family)
MMKKALLALLILAAIVLFAAFDLGRFFTLDFLKQTQGILASWQSNDAPLVAAAYFGLYVAIAALSLPGATIMTLAAGAIFGLAEGALLVSFASSVGAVLACASASTRAWHGTACFICSRCVSCPCFPSSSSICSWG